MFWSYLYAFIRKEYTNEKVLKIIYFWIIFLSIWLTLIDSFVYWIFQDSFNEFLIYYSVVWWIWLLLLIWILIKFFVFAIKERIIYEFFLRKNDIYELLEKRFDRIYWKDILNHYCIIFYWFIQIIFFYWLFLLSNLFINTTEFWKNLFIFTNLVLWMILLTTITVSFLSFIKIIFNQRNEW